MLVSSPAIVLGCTKYGENSVIIRTYTRNYGVLSFIAGGLGNKKGPLRPSMVQPLSQLEIVFYNRSKSNIRRIKEVSIPGSYQSLLFDAVKSCIALFLAEILNHVLHEEEKNEGLYDYISESIYELDAKEGDIANFHLVFLYRLATYLGFKPEQVQDMPYFDLMDGTYNQTEPLHSHFITGEVLQKWKILAHHLDSHQNIIINTWTRKELLQTILLYYRLHIKDFGNLRSLEVLHEVLH